MTTSLPIDVRFPRNSATYARKGFWVGYRGEVTGYDFENGRVMVTYHGSSSTRWFDAHDLMTEAEKQKSEQEEEKKIKQEVDELLGRAEECEGLHDWLKERASRARALFPVGSRVKLKDDANSVSIRRRKELLGKVGMVIGHPEWDKREKIIVDVSFGGPFPFGVDPADLIRGHIMTTFEPFTEQFED